MGAWSSTHAISFSCWGVADPVLACSLRTLVSHFYINEFSPSVLQGFLAHKKQPPPKTLEKDYVYGHMVAPRRVGVSYERGVCVCVCVWF